MDGLRWPGACKSGQRLQVKGGIHHGHRVSGVAEQFANLGQAAASGQNGPSCGMAQPVRTHRPQPCPGSMSGHDLGHGPACHRLRSAPGLQKYLAAYDTHRASTQVGHDRLPHIMRNRQTQPAPALDSRGHRRGAPVEVTQAQSGDLPPSGPIETTPSAARSPESPSSCHDRERPTAAEDPQQATLGEADPIGESPPFQPQPSDRSGSNPTSTQIPGIPSTPWRSASMTPTHIDSQAASHTNAPAEPTHLQDQPRQPCRPPQPETAGHAAHNTPSWPPGHPYQQPRSARNHRRRPPDGPGTLQNHHYCPC